mgnify:CR=1 FL=1
MFLDRLTRDEQVVFCQLAYAVMAADGEVSEKEAAFYDLAIRELDVEELPETSSEEGVVVPEGAFRLSASRHALVLELALLAVADGEVTTGEVAVLDAVADQMGLAPLNVQRSLDYAARLRDVLDEGFVLLAEAD